MKIESHMGVLEVENGIHAIGFLHGTDGYLVYSEWIMYETDKWYIMGDLFHRMIEVTV